MPAINSRGQDQGVEEIYQITIKKNDSGLLILIEIYDFIYICSIIFTGKFFTKNQVFMHTIVCVNHW